MDKKELMELQVGENIDNLINLDLRGYGVCRILYDAARKYTGKPLCINAAQQLMNKVKSGDTVFIITGFVFPPHNKGELDGLVGSMLLCRSLLMTVGAKPVIICEPELADAVKNLAAVVGINIYDSIEEMLTYPVSMAVIPFTKDYDKVNAEICALLEASMPAAVISIEHPGENVKGIYHLANGAAISHLASKVDKLFETLQSEGVLNIAIGDLGNEIGMGTISAQLNMYVPFAKMCSCGCGGGFTVRTTADNIITATTSDWACYGLSAALAFLSGNPEVLHNERLEERAMLKASESGLLDGSGWMIPRIDGFGLKFNMLIIKMLHQCIEYPLKTNKKYQAWFDKVIELGYFK